ncbi:hypothetical protein NXT08_25005 (plasmid) [Rhodococcus pyridinivorans]|uniref:hypothetical protein n=1 Tax=Rhodococcus pyridinivorans TaxID=103816 RepID=UPI0021640A7B|nr:hypothetical protein [Rhodococcus pyridinivorans]UVT27842.1 hypothetical protein NXT08_25005 [Rhodococcus pyridinivorans]
MMAARKGRAQKKESQVERLARSIIEHNSPVRLEPHDDGSENGMVDYQVFGKSESARESHLCIGVLEVGSITNSDFRSSYNQYTKRFKGFDTSSLSECWAVMCEFGVVFRGLEERLIPLLRKMEVRGLKSLARDRSDAGTTELEQEFAAIAGVVQVLQIPAGQRTTRVAIDFMWHTTGVTNPDSTLEVVEAFLSSNEKDPVGIRRKVMSDPALPYHGVCLHLDGAPESIPNSGFTEYRQFATPLECDVMPTRPPNLPPGFTDLWLIGKFRRGWHWNSDSGWTFVVAPSSVGRSDPDSPSVRSGSIGADLSDSVP